MEFKGYRLTYIYDADGNPWFVAKEVCAILGIDSTAVRRLDDHEKMNLRLTQFQTDGYGGDIGMRVIINESGL